MFPYESLEVYKKAFSANQMIYRMVKNSNIAVPFLRNQLGRASLSIMLNIAEGSAKTSVRDRRNFIVIARGSVFECAAIISFLFVEKEISEPVRNELYSVYEEISRMLFALIKSLEAK